MPYAVEVTDTFGGEANYSWVRRDSVSPPPDSIPYRSRSYRATIVRRAKARMGWSGMRTSTDDYGDSYTVRPTGSRAPCWVMFITWTDDATENEE